METSHNHEDGLSPAAKAAVAALRAEDDMPADARARVWDRLAAGAAREDMSVRTGRWRAGLVIGLAVAAGVVIAVAGVRRAAVEVAVDTAPAAQYGGESAGTQVAVRGGGGGVVKEEVPVAAPVVAEAASVDEPADRSPRTGRKRERAAGESVERGGPALGREAALLQQAQAALAGARAAEAIDRLAAYDREFGAGGVLRPEHDALRAVALCAAGRADEGRAAADAFLRAHAGSVQAERVRGACAAGP
jgi:hypothetical protein